MKICGRVHYICTYADDKSRQFLNYFPSSLVKINYVAETIKGLGIPLQIFSHCDYKDGVKEIKPYLNHLGIYCQYFKRIPSFLKGHFRYVYMCLQILWYIINNVKTDDTVLIYHSLLFRYVIPIARKIKKFRLIYEVNELYYTLSNTPAKYKRSELSCLKNCDGYILINDLLKSKIGIGNKPYVINHSVYKPLQFEKKEIGLDKNKIHVVYAGVIDQVRKAAFIAAESALYLPENYQVHILGFGNEQNQDKLRALIVRINNTSKSTKVEFHGIMYGDAYTQFLANCQIGLNCHTYSEQHKESADASFPSKVFVYLQHNLRVVSLPLECLRLSEIGPTVTFANSFTPEALAMAIQSVELRKQIDGAAILSELDRKFAQSLKELL